MLRRRVRQPEGDVRIPSAQAGEGIGGGDFQGDRGIAWHEFGEPRQEQAAQHRIGAGQAHGTTDDVLTLGQGDPRRVERLFGALGLFGEGLGALGGGVAATVLVEQRDLEIGFELADGAKHRGDIHLQLLGRSGQGPAAHQGENQLEIGMAYLILHRCIVPLPIRRYGLRLCQFILAQPRKGNQVEGRTLADRVGACSNHHPQPRCQTRTSKHNEAGQRQGCPS